MRISDDDLRQAWSASRTVREAADALGTYPSWVHKLAQRAGLPAKRRTRKPSPMASQARVLRAEGLTFRQIAAALGKSPSFVHKYARDVGRG